VDVRRGDLLRATGDPVRARSDRLASVEEEIRQTQAEALGRTGERLQSLLDRLRALDRRLDTLHAAAAAAPDDTAAPERIRIETEARNRVRSEAIRIRHHLIIQREALGLARQAPVEQCYPVPGHRSLPGRSAEPRRTP
jgi:hypothetical protein